MTTNNVGLATPTASNL